MRMLVAVALLTLLAIVSFLYIDLLVRQGYTRSSLERTQDEARDLAGLLAQDLSPEKLAVFAKTRNLPLERMKALLQTDIPTGGEAYRCGKLTFIFSGNGELVDVRGHLLDRSLLREN